MLEHFHCHFMVGDDTLFQRMHGNHVAGSTAKHIPGGCAYLKDGCMKILPANDDFVAVDTTGAGDNFLTGVIYGMIRDMSLEDSLKLGNLFAGKSTTGVGCFGASITLPEVERFLEADRCV